VLGTVRGVAHTHDGIDWSARLEDMKRADALDEDALRVVAGRLVRPLPDSPTVVDVGSGSGGMSAALAGTLGARGGGTLVLVDAVPELLDAATTAARAAAGGRVHVRPVLADLATAGLASLVPAAHLVWAARVVHHLPDQAGAVARLVEGLAPGGRLALEEGGLDSKHLPWDLGVGEPGLQERLIAARREWFARMRQDMPGSVRLPVGWNVALAEAGLTDVTAFSYLVEHQGPPTPAVRAAAVEWLTFHADVAGDRLHGSDRAAVRRLLDPGDDAWLGARDDVFVLQTRTVTLGRRSEA
jgi:SAM-dependent methyltransferase